MKRDAERLMEHFTELGRLRPLRDPISRLGGADLDLSPPQLHAVLWLDKDGPLPMQTLAARIGCAGPSTTGVVDRLENLGLARRVPKPGDRRVNLVELTDDGVETARAATEVILEQVIGALALLTADERKQLISIIGTLTERIRDALEEDA